ncbi:54S ribosomal protein L36, mitochondrial [Teratosphaeria destructans]|uniref:54S ribosomal protein L36, mitochondrial n=1 Tax=Teratosphaeria destructans TaxID=418781 RepID=A0A9W7SWM2_9PEZI|nr:54S ribosomal protein L36, mitochondrial [Teratosphaeria destructans]
MLVQSSTRPVCRQCQLHQQIRHASLIRRPKRPYTFTQMVTLSDGSTFLHRTTSPQPVYKSTKDTRNHALWNPSSQKLLNVEEDEAGRLKRFRKRFGRGFDVDAMEAEQARDGEEAVNADRQDASLLDLISGFGQNEQKKGKAAGKTEETKKSGKGKGGQK